MNEDLRKLYYKIKALSVFHELAYSAEISNLVCFFEAVDGLDAAEQVSCYAEFANAIYSGGGDLGLCMRKLALSGEDDPYLAEIIRGNKPAKWTEQALINDLSTLSQIAVITPEDLFGAIQFEDKAVITLADLPGWANTEVDLVSEYREMLSTVSTKGYGIYRDHIMFHLEDGEVVPVESPSYKPLEKFYGYKRERGEVLRNTEVLAQGGNASNVLLYGDAGTGKSSTVKACAAAFADQGVRLIEFAKSEVSEIPGVASGLKGSPLKFIFYVDDLSFTDSDDDFYCLKGILEGNVSGQPSNIVIYATSNRRHLVRESMEARQGDDIHLNDTLQEIMSVSARFGLTITFQKPAKDLYLEIVKEMADEYGVKYDSEEDLYKRAEAFAIRSNGRSPRTARQFVTLASEGMR